MWEGAVSEKTKICIYQLEKGGMEKDEYTNKA
jgi:hypothetical protein